MTKRELNVNATPRRSPAGLWPTVALACLSLLLAACDSGILDSSHREAAAVYPTDGSRAANAQTTISFRGMSPDDLVDVQVTGSASGLHDGEVVAHPDGKGVTFRPDQPFEPGEEVVVATDALTQLVDEGEIGFGVAVPADPADLEPVPGQQELPDPTVLDLATMPDAGVPETTVEGNVGSGVFLTTPRALGDSAAGAQIIDADGELVWWYPSPSDDVTVGDLEMHELNGDPVLAWYEGTAPYGPGKYFGEWVVVDPAYEEVTRIGGANGMPADLHDLVITDRGTAFVVAYQPVTMDMTEFGGPSDALVFDSVVQEVDIETGDVYFEWHSLDHVPLAGTKGAELSEDIVDYAHINSVDVGPDGNVLISLRHTSQVLEVDRGTGQPVWILGGDSNTVDVGDDTGISFPHHARYLPDGTISIFDNGVQRDDPTSRGVVYDVSDDGQSAEVVATYAADPPVFTARQGSVQIGDDGAITMWSLLGVANRFDADGRPTGTIDLGVPSYRLFAADWTGQPSAPPSIVVDADSIIVSWNGATEVDRWEALVDDEIVGTAPADSFETTIGLPADVADMAVAVTVRAVDEGGDTIDGSQATAQVP